MLTLHTGALESAWITVREAQGGDPAVRLKVRAGGTGAIVAGRRHARTAAKAGDTDDLETAFVAGAARWAAQEWEGVGDEKGKPLPFSADGVEALLRQEVDVFDAFDRDYVLPLMQRDAEKNVSSRSRTGTSRSAAKPTAKPARSRSAAKAAPTTKTPSKRKPASKSGTS